MLKTKFKLLAWASLSFIFILGLLTRLNILQKLTFWYDEAFSGILIRNDFNTIVATIIQDRVHPPVYYLSLKLWSDFFGHTDLVLRAFSLVFGLTLILASFVLIKKIFNTRSAIVASGLFALSPFFTLYSLEVRSYSMLILETLLAVVVFIKLYDLKFDKVKDLIKIKEFQLLMILCILMLFTHYLSIILIMSFTALLFIKIFPSFEKIMWGILLIILIFILGRGALNNGDFRIFPKEATHTAWLDDAKPLDAGKMLYSYIFGIDTQAIAQQPVFEIQALTNEISFLTILISSISIGLFAVFKRSGKVQTATKIFLLNILVISIASLFGINIFLPRYLTFLAVVYIVWIASIVSIINIRGVIIAGLLYLFLLSQVIWVNYNRNFGDINSLRETAKAERIAVYSPFDFLVLKYYLNDPNNLYFVDSPHWQMKNRLWPFFETQEIIDKPLVGDIVIQ